MLDHGRSAFCVVTPDDALCRVITALIELELGGRSVAGPTIEAVEQALGEALPRLFIVGDEANSTEALTQTLRLVATRYVGTPVIALLHQHNLAAVTDVPALGVYPLDRKSVV